MVNDVGDIKKKLLKKQLTDLQPSDFPDSGIYITDRVETKLDTEIQYINGSRLR